MLIYHFRTVGQTLEFAASTRTPSHRIRGMSRKEFAEHTAKVIMSVFGLSHTYNTKVGSDFVRGVSGGERKRVSIAEMALCGSPLAAWDNSTRGLDVSAIAIAVLELLIDDGPSLQLHSSLSTHSVRYQLSVALRTLWPSTRLHNRSMIFLTRPLCSTKVALSTTDQHPRLVPSSRSRVGLAISAKQLVIS